MQELCVVERQVVGWFPAPPGTFQPDAFPVFILDDGPGRCWYGFPSWGPQLGFKIGLYNHLRQVVRPDEVSRAERQHDDTGSALLLSSRALEVEDEAALRNAVRAFFPAADGPLLAHSTCLFTNTPDGHFVVDRHPHHPQVILCSACSGHGFKMSSGIGQLLARMVVAGSSPGTGFAGGEELRLHRISKDREGHDRFLRAAAVQAQIRAQQAAGHPQ
ncbi:DAO domain-containing protein [Haematococcus lacustris]|uniref:DAO domain-containing protein n=1 Tax=Haematococcus lacustris TaxID=44745 RepID=A0A699Z1Z4_HAELA|nr:DAO domain-containing protein [Haematococcus lacustris]